MDQRAGRRWPSCASGSGATPTSLRRPAPRGACAAFRRRFPGPAGWLYDVVDASRDGDDATAAPQPAARVRRCRTPRWRRTRRRCDRVAARPAHPARACAASRPDDPATAAGTAAARPSRDRAYHQGTVWPWLIGPYVGRLPRAAGRPVDGAARRARAPTWASGAWARSARPPTATPPHAATGCPFQAWSVAEVLRATRIGGGSSRAGSPTARHPRGCPRPRVSPPRRRDLGDLGRPGEQIGADADIAVGERGDPGEVGPADEHRVSPATLRRSRRPGRPAGAPATRRAASAVSPGMSTGPPPPPPHPHLLHRRQTDAQRGPDSGAPRLVDHHRGITRSAAGLHVVGRGPKDNHNRGTSGISDSPKGVLHQQRVPMAQQRLGTADAPTPAGGEHESGDAQRNLHRRSLRPKPSVTPRRRSTAPPTSGGGSAPGFAEQQPAGPAPRASPRRTPVGTSARGSAPAPRRAGRTPAGRAPGQTPTAGCPAAPAPTRPRWPG